MELGETAVLSKQVFLCSRSYSHTVVQTLTCVRIVILVYILTNVCIYSLHSDLILFFRHLHCIYTDIEQPVYILRIEH